ncbi:hypothetical protein ADU90_05850 (plasmid) [Clostridium botulinum]|uniref:Uncharacterized protein n=2 Tax=Clostridium botulinum TaxID=1491 RepID=A0A0A0HZM6_CLOBO|nr:hypothetical protein Z955_14855 [Clostridium botulinum C/D str. DC5]KOC56864.1 hypothetical protein ADU89_01310 [Clostridium botulinum]KOC57339.1 hypothetical protein ADU90_05850 [Clostridium botulinum]
MEHDFKIKKSNIENAFKTLKEYILTNNKPMWVIPHDIISAKNFYEAFEAIRYPLITNKNGDYILDHFSGEKLGDDKDILNSIAKYVAPNSYIKFIGEDDDVLILTFDGNECGEIWN